MRFKFSSIDDTIWRGGFIAGIGQFLLLRACYLDVQIDFIKTRISDSNQVDESIFSGNDGAAKFGDSRSTRFR